MKELKINEIFYLYKDDFLKLFRNKLHPVQLKTLKDIVNCRTENFGGKIIQCDNCKEKFILYYSCKNRHCPQCMNLAKEKWILSKKNNILPVKYYHIIFTLPHELNNIIYYNQKSVLNLFFKTVADTIIQLGLDPKHLGAKTGILSILHTWDQKLNYHPHIHCLVPAGGLSEDKSKWINSKYENYLIPAAVIADLFKKKFLCRLRFMYKFDSEKLSFEFNKEFENYSFFNKLINSLYEIQWNVKVTDPYINPETVIDYFGRYSHKVAISDYRIIKLENDIVYIRCRDNNNKGFKIVPLKAVEFIRRFLLHVLPKNFSKIRSYGLFANSVIKKNIRICKKLLDYTINIFSEFYEVLKEKTSELLSFFCNIKQYKCKNCKKGNLITIYDFKRGETPMLN